MNSAIYVCEGRGHIKTLQYCDGLLGWVRGGGGSQGVRRIWGRGRVAKTRGANGGSEKYAYTWFDGGVFVACHCYVSIALYKHVMPRYAKNANVEQSEQVM